MKHIIEILIMIYKIINEFLKDLIKIYILVKHAKIKVSDFH